MIMIKISIYLVLIAAFIGSCSYINDRFGLGDDHFAEEALEDFIKHETGIEIDLTPESPED